MKIEDRIIKSCMELVQSRGLRSFTVNELAARAGISKRTLYRYYRSKEEILEAVVDRFMDEAAAEGDLIIKVESNPVAVMNHLLNYLFKNGRFIISEPGLNDLRQYYPQLWQKIDYFRSQRIAMFIEIINSNRKDATEFDIDPRIVSAAIIAAIQAVLNPDFILENGLTFESTAEQLLRLLMPAVEKDL